MKKILLLAIVLVLATLTQAQTIRPVEYLDRYMELKTAVVMGRIPGAFALDKFGENPAIPDEGAGVIWEYGGEYIYDVDSTAPIKYLSSSNALDVGQTITISGLDSLGELTTQNIITTGQTNATLTTPLWRVFRMENISKFAVGDVVGMLYCHTDASPTAGVPTGSAIRAMINDGNNQTLMSVYTVPAGYVGFLFRGELGLGLSGNQQTTSEYVRAEYRSRRFGSILRVKKRITLSLNGNSNYQDSRSFPDVIPALTDVQLRVVYASEASVVWGTFDMLIFKEDHFPAHWLEGIGQPGY